MGLETITEVKISDEQVVKSFNVHRDYLEALFDRLMKQEAIIAEHEQIIKRLTSKEAY